MMVPPWAQYELGRIRMEDALEASARECQVRGVGERPGLRPRWMAVLSIAGAALLIYEALKTLFTARRRVTGL
jgi:hypothetical protein